MIIFGGDFRARTPTEEEHCYFDFSVFQLLTRMFQPATIVEL